MAEEGSKRPDSQQVRGPMMLVATRVMNPGPARVGRLFGDVTLPRTVELPVLIAGGVGGVIGLVVGLLLGGLSAALYGTVLFGALGVFAVTYSPLEGESLARWLGLTLRSKRHRVLFEGEQVQVSIGIRPIEPALDETVRLAAGHVDVPSWQYDRRGVRISQANQNLGEAAAPDEESTWAHASVQSGAPPAWVEHGVTGGLGPVRSLPQDPAADPVLASRRGRLHQGLPDTTGRPVASPPPTPPEQPDPGPAPADGGPMGEPAAGPEPVVPQPPPAPQPTAAPEHTDPAPAPRPSDPETQPAPAAQDPAPPAPPTPQVPPPSSGDGVRRMKLGKGNGPDEGDRKRRPKDKLPRFKG